MRENAIMFTIALLIIGAVTSRGTFADEATARNALETQGYSNITITNHAWFAVGLRGCAEKDAARFDATATNPAGRAVKVYVCTGFPFKGATIRT